MSETMKAAVLHAPADLRVEEVAKPVMKAGEALIRVKSVGICGSDLDRIMKTGTYSFPCIPGHEFCGEVADICDNENGIKTGDRVCVAPILPCFKCDSCAHGDYGQCENYNYLGSRTNGGMAEYVCAPVMNLIPMPKNVGFVEGGAVEPAAVTLHGMMRAGIKAGDTVAVFGCGTIGLFAVQFARILGATRIIAVDIDESKLTEAVSIGATDTINSMQDDAPAAILALTGGKGADVCAETAGVPVTQEQCLRSARPHGTILYLGTAHKDVVFPPKAFEKIVRGELTITGSWNSYSAPFPGVEWKAVLSYAASGALDIATAITHKISLDEAPDMIARMAKREFSFNKVVILI